MSAYPLDGPVIVLPFEVSDETAPYLKQKLSSLSSRRRVVLVICFAGYIQSWLEAHLDALGFAPTHRSSHGAVSVTVFEPDLDAS